MSLINFILFQLAWLACVTGAATGMPWLGVAITIAVLAWHLHKAQQAKPELLLMLAALAIGSCVDQSMLSMQIVEYQQHGWNASFVPVWILALWLAFATTLNVSLAWMQGRYLLSMLLGAVGGPLAYFGAENIGAVLLHSNIAYIALSVSWAVVTPLLVYLAGHLNGFKSEATP